MSKKINAVDTNIRDEGLENLINGLSKTLGIKPKRGQDFEDVECLSTGQMEVDLILGDHHGIPRGTLLELAGESQSGKTYLALKLIAEAHKRNEKALFLNVENSFYAPRAESLGVDVRNKNKFILWENIGTAEQYGFLLQKMVESAQFSVIVVDSITALIPQDAWNKDFQNPVKIGEHARFIGRLLQKLLYATSISGTIVVLINQMRMKQGILPGKMIEGTTGGKGMEFYTHMRLWLKRIGGKNGHIIGNDGVSIIGGKSRVLVKKTRFGEPGLETEFPIYFQKEEVNPIGEFLYRASARGKDYIALIRKKYAYSDQNSESIKESDPIVFVKKLMEHPSPENKSKNDYSSTAFEYIADKLKLTELQQKDIILAIENTGNEQLIKYMENDGVSKIFGSNGDEQNNDIDDIDDICDVPEDYIEED